MARSYRLQMNVMVWLRNLLLRKIFGRIHAVNVRYYHLHTQTNRHQAHNIQLRRRFVSSYSDR